MTFKALEAAQSSYSLGPLVTEDDTEQIQYEVYEMGTYSFAIKTDSVLTEGQTLVLHNKLGHKKFHVEPILDFEGHFKLYSEEHTRLSNLAVFKGERPSTQSPRFDMDMETRVFVKTFGSASIYDGLNKCFKTGFRMDTGNMTHKIPLEKILLLKLLCHFSLVSQKIFLYWEKLFGLLMTVSRDLKISSVSRWLTLKNQKSQLASLLVAEKMNMKAKLKNFT